MEYLTHQSEGSGELIIDIDPNQTVNLKAIFLHLNAAGLTGTFLVSACNKKDTSFNTYFIAKPMETVSDYVFIPESDFPITADTYLHFEWGNEQSKRWALTVIWR